MRLVLLFGLLVLTVAPASAQMFGDAPPRSARDVVTWRVGSQHGSVGGEAALVLRAEIKDGWHLYAVGSPVGRPLEVEILEAPAGVATEALLQSDPHQGTDPGLGVPYLYFSEEADVILPLRIGRRVAPGRHRVRGVIRYAVCDDSVCLPPTETRFRVPLVVR